MAGLAAGSVRGREVLCLWPMPEPALSLTRVDSQGGLRRREIDGWSPTPADGDWQGGRPSCRRSPGRHRRGDWEPGFDPWPAATAEAMSAGCLWGLAAAIASGAGGGQV